jgi:hypothetical protein
MERKGEEGSRLLVIVTKYVHMCISGGSYQRPGKARIAARDWSIHIQLDTGVRLGCWVTIMVRKTLSFRGWLWLLFVYALYTPLF